MLTLHAHIPLLADAQHPASQSMLPLALAILGMMIILWTLLRMFRKRAEQRAQEPDTARGRIDQIREQHSRADPVGEVMADAEELTRRFAAQLDNRAARLEHLLDLADERIRRLEQLNGADRQHPAREHADPVTRQVYDLADQGYSSVEIAQQLDQQTGKVDLILALRQQS